MEWIDHSIVLGASKFGEADAIIDVFSRDFGRYKGFVRGGMGRTKRSQIQAGNEAKITWRARVEESLGSITLDPMTQRAAHVFHAPDRLAALSSVTSLLSICLPEREPVPPVFDALMALLDVIEQDDVPLHMWGVAFVRFEMGLLATMGFGLDLSSCASTGQVDDLAYVSPRSGRAVSREAGAPYQDKLFALPTFMRGGTQADREDIGLGLDITGFFLDRHVLGAMGKTLPDARFRLRDYFSTEK